MDKEDKLELINDYDMSMDYYKAGIKRDGNENEFYVEILQTIKNKEDIEILDIAMLSSSWKQADGQFKEEPMLFLIINDKTMMWLFGGGNHAQLMNYKSDGDKITSWKNISEIFVLNDDAYSIIEDLVGEY